MFANLKSRSYPHVVHGGRGARRSLPALGAVAFVLALAVTGCGEKRTGTLNPDLRSDTRPPPVARASQPPRTAAPLSSTIRQPLSQAELDDAYRAGEYPPPRAAQPQTYVRPSISVPVPQDDSTAGEAEWNVQVSREWRHIVVHHSGSASGSAAEFDKYHRSRGWDGLGYHFVIGNGHGAGDGEVETGLRWRKQMAGAHAGEIEYNQHGIGICLVGDFEHGQQPSARQMASLRRLVRFLQARTGVPTSEVVGHNDVPGKRTECPGRNLNLSAFRASLGSAGAPAPYRTATTPAARPRVAVSPRGAGSAALP